MLGKVTLAEALQLNSGNIEDLIVDDLLLDAPFLRLLPVIEASDDTRHKYLKRIEAPETGFRGINQGQDNTKTVRKLVEFALGYIDATFEMDRAVFRSKSGKSLWTEEAKDHLQSAFATLERQLFYGTTPAVPAGSKVGEHPDATKGFGGLASDLSVQFKDAEKVIDAGGTGPNLTSAWLVRVGESDVCAVSPEGGLDIEIGEAFDCKMEGTNSKQHNGKRTPIESYLGLKLGGRHSYARICNIDVSEGSTNGLTDTLLRRSRALFPAGRKGNYCVLSEEAQNTLADSRVATNPLGTEVPVVERAHGYTFITSDGIKNDEPALVAKPA